jgi:dTMP kinase
MAKKRGSLISFEGGEGAGKSVQIKRLRDRLYKAGRDVVVARDPGGTVIGEQIREILLSPKNVGIAYTTEVLLFQAARAQNFREIVLPSMKAGKVVLADRSRDSSTVYQGIVRGFGVALIEGLNDLATQKTYPDLTILLDVTVETGLGRRNNTKHINRLDMEAREFHQKVRSAYLRLAKADDHKRWVVVDAERAIEEIADQIWEEVKRRKVT